MKNKLYKGTIGLFAAMLACGTILIGSPASVEAVPVESGSESTDEDSRGNGNVDDGAIPAPQNDNDKVSKVNE